QDRTDREKEAEAREREREMRTYDQGRELLDQGKYDRAIDRFNDVIGMKGTRADAALYYKAWSQNRLGQRAEALTTIATLARDYPKSRYLTQARALEAEVKSASGQPVRVSSQDDEDMQRYALQGIVNASPEQAIPVVEKILNG